MKKVMQRGFTLIELLVVIAIIGILAAVVLASLNDARDGGKDASAKGSMTSIRNQMELFYNDQNYTYALGCDDADVSNLLDAATSTVGTTDAACDETATGDGYAAWTALTNTTDFFCVDSTGFAGITTDPGAGATSCP